MEIRDFRIGQWLVRPESGELSGPEGSVQLKPRTVQVLQDLARHAGELRTREQVLSAVWGDAFVGEEVLSHCVWELRRALGDDSRKPRYIQTVHRKGYKLIAPISWLDTEPAVGGRYRLGEKIGDGSMGVVYAAEDLRLERRIALKFLPPELSRLPDAKEGFLREARLAAALDHPNLCALYEVDETEDGQLFLVMPRYEGETLKRRLRRGPLPWGEALEIARQLARGLAAAHAAGVIHRDVKPSNVFLTADAGAKLLDFGVARLADATQSSRYSSSHGTPAYMSPEQAEGDRVDARTDLWSLGVVLYEALTGERPFRGEHEQAVIYAILNRDPEPLAERCPGVPPRFAALVAELLSKPPADRPADARAVLAALDEPTDAAEAPGAGAEPPPAAVETHPERRDDGLRLLLDRVERFWIDQALAQSLGGVPPHPLTLEPRPDAVEHPWGELAPAGGPAPGIASGEPLTETFHRLGRSLLLLGEAGAGKTVTLLRLAEEAIAAARGDPAEPVPVVVQLASWADRAPAFESWLEDEISRRYYLPRRAVHGWLSSGALMLLLDGLDEVEAPRRGRCVAAINRFHEAMPLIPLAVTCRSEDHWNLVREGRRLRLAGALAIQPLEPADVEAALGGHPALEQLRGDRALGELARSPLILSILRRVGLDAADDAAGAPARASPQERLLYRYVRGCLRGRGGAYAPYSERQAVGWLSSLARSMLDHHRSLFQLEEIQPSWLRATWRRGAYLLLSRVAVGLVLSLAFVGMIQATGVLGPTPIILGSGILAGLLIAGLDLCLLGRPAAAAGAAGANGAAGQWLYPSLMAAAAVTATVVPQRLFLPEGSPVGPFLFASCIFLVFRRRPDGVRWTSDVATVETFRWSWAAAGRGWLVWAGLILAGMIALGIARAAVEGPLDALRLLPNAMLTGVIPAVLIGLRPGLVDVKTRPNHGVWLSARNASLGGFLLFAGTFLSGSLGGLLASRGLLGPTHLMHDIGARGGFAFLWAMSVGLAVVGATGFGGVELIKHFALRLLLWTEGAAPVRYPRFLDYAARCTLLRRAGGGYVFAHRSLQEYLASLGN